MHTKEMEEEVIKTASRSGMIDMYGDLIPAIDGCCIEMNTSIVSLMRETIKSAMELRRTCTTWFEKVIELGFYEDQINEVYENKKII